MHDFTLVFYKKANGDCPVAEFLDSLNREMRFKMMAQLDKIELYGNLLSGDHSKAVGDGLFEVRAQNKTDITRILFFFDKDRKIVLTNGFIKKTQRMPNAELDTAKRYRAEYLDKGRDRVLSDKSVRKETPKTVGPKWRVELDMILAETKQRAAMQGKSGQLRGVSLDGKDSR